jgi:hypothetical protein
MSRPFQGYLRMTISLRDPESDGPVSNAWSLETIGEGSIRNTLDPRRETGRTTDCFSIHGRFRLLSQSVTGRPQYRYHIDRAEVVWDESSNPVLKSTSFEVGLVLRLFPTKSCWITTFSSLISLIPRFVYLSLRVSICSHVLG